MKHIVELKKLFGSILSWHGSRITFLALFITSMLQEKTVNLSAIANGFATKGKRSGKIRRVEDFFRKFKIDYDEIAKLLSSFIENLSKWTLTMDRTNWQFGKININILYLAIAYKSVAIPLFWAILEKKDENDNIKEIISEMPKGYFAFKLYDLFDSDGGEFYYEDGNDVIIKGLWIAVDEDYANKRANSIKENYESNGYNNYNVRVEGNRVISELRISKKEFADDYGYELADVHWLGLHELENCKSSAETEELANNEEQTNIEQQTEEQQTNMEEQKEQQFENKETNTYELPLTWKEVEVAGMDGAMFDFGSKKVTFRDIYEYSHHTFDFEDPIIIDGNRLSFDLLCLN